jgi:UDP:flavonoid glycosyltransferase YjiC (YdhE family)
MLHQRLYFSPPGIASFRDRVHRIGHRKATDHFHDRAGVPQLILPQWFDLYNFARLVEYTGVGLWGCPETSPEWTVECLADALLTVTTGSSAREMRQRAKQLEEVARNSPGSPFAAREIARLAAAGKVL